MDSKVKDSLYYLGFLVVCVIILALLAKGLNRYEYNMKRGSTVANMVPEVVLSSSEKREYNLALQDVVKNTSGFESDGMKRWLKKIEKSHPEGGRLPIIDSKSKLSERIVAMDDVYILVPAK